MSDYDEQTNNCLIKIARVARNRRERMRDNSDTEVLILGGVGVHLRKASAYGVAVAPVLSWPAMCLRSFGYSTISIRRLDDRPSSESFEARGCVSA